MVQRYLRTTFCLFLLFLPFLSKAQVSPFQDYVKCKGGFLKGKRDTLYPAKFDQIKEISFHSKKAWIVSEKSIYGCIGADGSWILPLKYQKVEFQDLWDAFLVGENGKVGVISTSKTTIIPLEYDEIYSEIYDKMYYGWIFARKGKLIAAFNGQGKLMIPANYEKIERISVNDYPHTMTFFRVKTENAFGLVSEEGKEIIPVKYKEIALFQNADVGGENVFFMIKNDQDQSAIVDQTGHQYLPFEKMELRPVYTVETVVRNRSIDYVHGMDSTGREQLWNLQSGKKSDLYDHISIIGKYCVANQKGSFLILDTNFNLLFRYSNLNDVLETFDMRTDLSSENKYDDVRYSEWKEFVSELDGRYDRTSDLPILKIHRTVELSHKQAKKKGYTTEEFYGILNLETGKSSSVIYQDLLRVGSWKGVYYWGVRKEKGQGEDQFTADVYDSTGVFLRSTQFNESEYQQITDFLEDETYVLRPFVPLGQRDAEGRMKYSGYLMNGNRVADYIFVQRPFLATTTSDSTGVLGFHSTNDGSRYTDFDNKPLLSNRTFHHDWDWNFLHDGPNAHKYSFNVLKLDIEGSFTGDDLKIIVDDKLQILLDSCTHVNYHRFTEHPKLDPSKAYLIAQKHGFYYVQYNGTFVPLDSTFFNNPTNANLVINKLRVDNNGKILDLNKPQASSFEFKNLKYTTYDGTLTITDLKGKVIQEVKNVINVGRMSSVIYVVNTNNKIGLIDPETGQWFFIPQYDEVHEVNSASSDLFYARLLSRSDKWMIVKQDGTPITEPIFDNAQWLNRNSWTVIRSFDKYGTIGPDFKFICQPKYKNKIEVGDEEVFVGENVYAMIDQTTGKVFEFNRKLVNRDYSKGHLFYFNDSIQFLNLAGVEIIPPTPVSTVVKTINLSKVFYGNSVIKNWDHSFVDVGISYCADQDTALWMYNNQLLMDEAKKWVLNWDQFSYGKLQTQKQAIKCTIEPLIVIKQMYSEQVTGRCYQQPEISSTSTQTYSYRNYRIDKDKMTPLKLSDLFLPESKYVDRIDAYLLKKIQNEQYFGPNCLDLDRIIAEFKKNFYLSYTGIRFVFYAENIQIEMPFTELTEVMK